MPHLVWILLTQALWTFSVLRKCLLCLLKRPQWVNLNWSIRKFRIKLKRSSSHSCMYQWRNSSLWYWSAFLNKCTNIGLKILNFRLSKFDDTLFFPTSMDIFLIDVVLFSEALSKMILMLFSLLICCDLYFRKLSWKNKFSTKDLKYRL